MSSLGEGRRIDRGTRCWKGDFVAENTVCIVSSSPISSSDISTERSTSEQAGGSFVYPRSHPVHLLGLLRPADRTSPHAPHPALSLSTIQGAKYTKRTVLARGRLLGSGLPVRHSTIGSSSSASVRSSDSESAADSDCASVPVPVPLSVSESESSSLSHSVTRIGATNPVPICPSQAVAKVMTMWSSCRDIKDMGTAKSGCEVPGIAIMGREAWGFVPSPPRLEAEVPSTSLSRL